MISHNLSRVLLSPVLRYLAAVCAGVIATAMVFVLMHRLIGTDPLQVDRDTVFATVEIYQPPPPPPAPEPEPDEPPPASVPDAPVPEPVMKPLAISAPAATPTVKVSGPPVSSFEFSANDIVLPSGDGGLLGSGAGDGNSARWTPPGGEQLAKKIAAAEAKGGEGYKEIVPFATRQPNVPKVAWDQKIDGWVLVAFSVNASGHVENVRVLDANPKGIFEDNVVAAVADWLYDPANFGGKKVKVQLTQKIQLYWKDYPNNITQLK